MLCFNLFSQTTRKTLKIIFDTIIRPTLFIMFKSKDISLRYLDFFETIFLSLRRPKFWPYITYDIEKALYWLPRNIISMYSPEYRDKKHESVLKNMIIFEIYYVIYYLSLSVGKNNNKDCK